MFSKNMEGMVTKSHSLGQGGIDDGGPLNLYLKKMQFSEGAA